MRELSEDAGSRPHSLGRSWVWDFENRGEEQVRSKSLKGLCFLFSW